MISSRLWRVVIVAVVYFAINNEAHCRLVECWPYQQLFEKSDVILIATYLETKETGRIERVGAHIWKDLDFKEMASKFVVEHVIKGPADIKTFSLYHFQPDDAKHWVNGPVAARFKRCMVTPTIRKDHFGNDEIIGKRVHSVSYILFLKKGADGNLRPVTGDIDSSYSVKEIVSGDDE